MAGRERIFIGGATDPKFVGPTSVMLSSLDEKGGVDEAEILIADFDLSATDRAVLRDAAGRLGPAMRFVPIHRHSPQVVALPAFDFPFPLIGRLVLPAEVDAPGTRMLLIDSDVVVNHSVRPLFEMDLGGRPLAAVQDPLMDYEFAQFGRASRDYFNAGVMLFDLDSFRRDRLGEAAMHRLASYEHKPNFLDQDALNDVLADNWVELDRLWNFFQTGYGPHFFREDFEQAHIIHFAGPKPWEWRDHAAVTLYDHHAEAAERKITAWRTRLDRHAVDRDFVETAYELLLGRDLEDGAVADERAGFPASVVLAGMIGCDEFATAVLSPLATTGALSPHAFREPLRRRQRHWAAEWLPTLPDTRPAVLAAESWRDLLAALVADPRFMSLAGLEPVLPAEPVAAPPPPPPRPRTPWDRVRAALRG